MQGQCVDKKNCSNYGDIQRASSFISAEDSTYAPGDDDDLSETASLLSTNNGYSSAASQASYFGLFCLARVRPTETT
eukprot:13315940-Ditylum_brightwellii.AAC.1